MATPPPATDRGHGTVGPTAAGPVRRWVRDRLRPAPRVLVTAQVLHVAGDAAVAVALATTMFFDVPVGEARTDVGLYLLLSFAPYAALTVLFGPYLARQRQAHGAVLVATHVGRAILAVLLISHGDDPWLYPIGFGVLVLSRAHGVARASLVPARVQSDRLVDANAAISFVSGIAGAVGGLVALLLAGLTGAGGVLGWAAGMYGAGSLLGLWLRPPGRLSVTSVEDKGWLTGTDSLRITATTATARLCVGFAALLVAFRFHGPDERAWFVAAGIALGVGTWAASVITPTLGRMGSEVAVASAALAGLALVGLLDAVVNGRQAALTLAGAAGLVAGITRLTFDAHVQDRWPERSRGPGYVRYEPLLQVAWVAGAAVASFLDLSLAAGSAAVAVAALAGLALVTIVGRGPAEDGSG